MILVLDDKHKNDLLFLLDKAPEGKFWILIKIYDLLLSYK